jgi:Flp pilus assembly pilin Flp
MSRTHRSAVCRPAERGATVVTYALMIAIATLLVSVGFIFLQGGIGTNLRRGGDCLASIDQPGFDPATNGCPKGFTPGGGSGGSGGTTTTSPGSTTSTSTSTTLPG